MAAEGAQSGTSQADELASLAGGFVHEIKNHLGTLILNIQLLAEDLDEPETPRERNAARRVKQLTEECQEILDLANDFLRFSRITELHCQPASLDHVVSRMVDFLMPTARLQNVEIQWHSAPELPLIPLDVELFEKVLLNLMLNAEDAMPEGGTLTMQSRQEGDTVCLDIIDTGIGIPKEMLGKIFQPFVTTKESGHGLGLATSKKIIVAHGGKIEVQSEPGRGTKFTLILPVR
jgi:signal transduction histidine kinase